jgi:Terminase large subunit, T4likevirus-type, N-terminal
MELKINLPELHPAQREIVDHPARFKVLACGRRFGKTQAALDLIAFHLLEGHAVAYFAPSQIMTLEVWETVKRLFLPLISRVQEDQSRIEFLNHALFECWTARTEAVRGRKYHFVVIDEAALIPDAALWQAVIRPLLTDYRGAALFASTPRGRNWFWQLYRLGLNPAVSDWHSWTFPTSANPFIDITEVDNARRDLPDHIFQQEYLARFIEDAGMVFRDLDAVCMAAPVPDPQPGYTYLFGVDWARDNDFTVISVMAAPDPPETPAPVVTEKVKPVQVYLDRFNQVSYNLQRDRLKWLNDRYQPRVILAEANSVGSVNIDALIREGLPVRSFNTTLQSKAKLIETLSLAIQRHDLTLLNDHILTHELQAYEMSRTAAGHWHYSAPPGDHDDTVIATALSYWAFSYHRSLPISFA